MKELIRKLLNKNINYTFLYLLIPLTYIEFTFHTIAFKISDIFVYLRSFFFILFFSFFISIILKAVKNEKAVFIINLIIVTFFSLYSFVELEFKRFVDTYYSFNSVSDMGLAISEYVFYFLSDALPVYYLCLLGIPLYILIYKKMNIYKGDILSNAMACVSSLIILLLLFDYGNNPLPITRTYATFGNIEYLVEKIGITHFFFRDITALSIKSETIEINQIEIEEEEIKEETITKEIKHRTFNDTRWKQIIDTETNNTLKSLDEFFINQRITDYNDKSGIFENYNYIDIIVESLDYLSIDKDLTPTLYKVFNEGISFINHYTPKYSCASGDTEFTSLTSLVPINYTCTINEILNNDLYEALPYLFKYKGYSTYSFHNWTEQFYKRKDMSNNWGFDLYKDFDDLKFKVVEGWQSDLALIEKTFDEYCNDDKFFVHYVTSTMHWPYDLSSYYGDLDVDKVKSVHPDWEIDYCRYMSKCMEFDRALAKLLELLNQKGISNNTVIAIYTDHRPHKLNEKTIISLTSNMINRSENNGIDLTPYIIYCPTIDREVNKTVCSTLDQLPTIANMFNLDFDPRLYIGKDIYAGGSRFVFFPNGDWINEKGNYDLSLNKYAGNEISGDDIKKLSLRPQSLYNTSKIILKNNYFSKRTALIRP